jgi:hypothetical protein
MAVSWRDRFTARTAAGYRFDRRKAFRCVICDAKCVGGNTLALYCSKRCYAKAAWRRKRAVNATKREMKGIFGG